ncbi:MULTISPECIES: hypothetical protein [unclassified Kribbella]
MKHYLTVADVMTTDVVTVAGEDTVGIVTRSDLLKAFLSPDGCP